MTIEYVAKILIELLYELQKRSGHPEVELTFDSRPLTDLPEFDSLSGIEVVLDFEERLGVEIEGEGLFVAKDGGDPLCIRDMAKIVCEKVKFDE